MHSDVETAERRHLEHVQQKLSNALTRAAARASSYAREVRDQKTHMWEHRRDMDHAEKAASRVATEATMATGQVAAASEQRIRKLLASPYFGRFDFQRQGEDARPLSVYVGVHGFTDDEDGEPLVFDWRAPISTIFYDYETGRAQYDSPSGRVTGDVLLKRQFRIRNGRMDFMLESGLNIVDDVLQQELSRTSDERMKNIVATIQRDQNAIVRNEDAEVLIIQGVAGSGKTSIALHRIAFLLYRHKDTLNAKNVVIISPNRVFADFISNVLPELGEEPIAEIDMEQLADQLLNREHKFQTLFDQTAALLEGKDKSLARRIEAKSSFEFLQKLDEYVGFVEASRFRAADVQVGAHMIPAAVLEEAYGRRSDLRAADRVRWVAEYAEHHATNRWRHEPTSKERAAIKAAVRKMYRGTTLRNAYKQFYEWLGKPELLRPAAASTLEFSDVFPLAYLKIRLEGFDAAYGHVKHLVVDEMQDYTPVQYAVIERLFRCGKTILGDVSQSVHASVASTSDTISRVFRRAECVKLCRSYRSSYEITQFAQAISPNPELIAIQRHGEVPVVAACATEDDELSRIELAIDEFERRGHQTMAIICKTQGAAERLHRRLLVRAREVYLLTGESKTFIRGVVVCSAHLAKGLEFDEVVVPHATASTYSTLLDRNLLYVACTRAMHVLLVTHVGAPSRFVPNASAKNGEDS